MSRGRLAADLGVDKSLVGRWASGTVTPSAHNLENLTRLIASRQPGFTMLHWDRELDELGRVFGVEPAPTPATVSYIPPPVAPVGLPLPGLDLARLVTERRAGTYEGFWRSTRPSIAMPGRLFHDHGMIRRGPDGILQFTMGGSGLLFDGWMLPVEGQLFAILFDTVGQTPVFLIFNGVALHKATQLDGLILAAALNAARTPSAYPVVLERIGDLTGDCEADDARCQELLASDPAAPDGSVPEDIRRHLIRDIGPEAVKSGAGELFLLSSWANSLSRGLSTGGHLQG
ncbi:helix-turn-helix transcriptional regulator [Phenylobacterium sp.]|uniref:helix-turn-helix domain-containing protein n=1 Tax=Phenylobacterium sp. TaxID=1871053 RepID=UPI002734D454|nr:helix-turn-helix transcriptional regulator [Phenylobacterium sp.]MDP3173433.1 helix-turn-helix transcriptional regulator [Phenylobacterium sp.]MDP3660754.1 helix-turn-helix transcriptional regulator [Phenylobacterium sp.]